MVHYRSQTVSKRVKIMTIFTCNLEVSSASYMKGFNFGTILLTTFLACLLLSCSMKKGLTSTLAHLLCGFKASSKTYES